jgi:hypothetical protein
LSGINLFSLSGYQEENTLLLLVVKRRTGELINGLVVLGIRSHESHERYGRDGVFGSAAEAAQLAAATIEPRGLDHGGVPLHVLGGQPVGFLFQNLLKARRMAAVI